MKFLFDFYESLSSFALNQEIIRRKYMKISYILKEAVKPRLVAKQQTKLPGALGVSRLEVWHVNRNNRVTPTRPRLSRPINYHFAPQKSTSRQYGRVQVGTTTKCDAVTRVSFGSVSRAPRREGQVKILMWCLSQSAFYWRRVKGPQARKRIKFSLEFATTTGNGMTLVFFILEFLVWSDGCRPGYSKTNSNAICHQDWLLELPRSLFDSKV